MIFIFNRIVEPSCRDQRYNLYIYIVIHRHTCFVLSELFSVARQARSRTGIETRLTQTLIQDSTTQPRGNQRKRRKFKRLCITFVFVYIHPLNGNRELDSYEEPCIKLVATIICIYIYVYIYIFRSEAITIYG